MGLVDFDIRYDNNDEVVNAKVINRFANINSPNYYKDSTIKIRELLKDNNCNKLFADYSLIGIQLHYDLEYYLAKNFNTIFDYPEGTISVIYEGKFYSEKKWGLIRSIFKEDGVTNVEIFGDYNQAMEWLKSK